jgi:His/Glu/Gln/Arg/opine family amino acid ABC transporter permease subunit
MSRVEEVRTPQVGPPDVRGPTSPWPASIFAVGIAALGAVLGGTLILQLAYAIGGGSLTARCVSEGLVKNQAVGARGVCNIITALKSGSETALLGAGLVLGVGAIAAGFGTYRAMDTRRKREHALAGAILGIQAVALAGLLLWFRSGGLLFPFVRNFLNFTYLKGQTHLFVEAAGRTLFLAFGGEAGGIVLGLILAIFAMSERRVVRAPARAYINFFRGTPLIWQISFMYFGLILGLNLHLTSFTTAILVFALNTGAYAAEVFRAGLQSIERGQMEAARSLGMSYGQALRYAIVPQAVRRVIPPLMNEFVILIKDTALVFVIGITLGREELFSLGQEGFSTTFNATYYVAVAMGYLAITLPLIRLVNAVEHRLRSGLLSITGMAGI